MGTVIQVSSHHIKIQNKSIQSHFQEGLISEVNIWQKR